MESSAARIYAAIVPRVCDYSSMRGDMNAGRREDIAQSRLRRVPDELAARGDIAKAEARRGCTQKQDLLCRH
jgi:hypothetical protein